MVEPQLVERYVETGKVRLVWRDFAWIGEESRLAAQGAHCAARQGRFWAYHDHLFRQQRGYNQGQFAPDKLVAYAGELGLETAAFEDCLDKQEDLPAIQQGLADGRSRGVRATPYFLIDGQPLVAGSADQMFQAIEAALSEKGR